MARIRLPGNTHGVLSQWYSGQGDPLYRIMSAFSLGVGRGRLDWDDSGTHFLFEADEEERAALDRLADVIESAANASDYDLYWVEDFRSMKRRQR